MNHSKLNHSNQTRREFLAAGAAAALAVSAPPARADSTDLASLTLKRAGDALRNRTASAVELTEACLKRIEKYNSMLNAFITVTREQALTRAREMEGEHKRGRFIGPLDGIPIALKDNIDTAGVRTTGASELFRDRVPVEDAEVVRRLKNAGAIVVGKLNLVEFAYGGNSAQTAFGTVHNPWALDRTTGGSSSGPAAAIAADLCFGSLGTDTAGSVRSPASFCGIVGFKPTYGRVSCRGVIPLSWTLDHVGPLCKTVEDAALLLAAVAGYDPLDPTTADVSVPDYARALKTPTARLRLGRPRPFFEGMDAEVAKAVEAAIEVLRRLTAGIQEVQLPSSGSPAQVWGPEGYAYHSKWIAESPGKYQPATLRSLQQSADTKAAVYAQALREVQLARREVRKLFTAVDVLVVPTTVNTAGKIGDTAPPGRNNNAPFDVFGLPAISVPCGITSAGLPVGLQIVGAHFAEATVLALAHAYEQATDWHNRHSKLF